MAKRKSRRYEEVEYYRLSPETKRGILIVSLFALALICILGFLNLAGIAGAYVDFGLGVAFGWGRFLFPIILLVLGYVLARPQAYKINWHNYLGLGIFILSAHALLQLSAPQIQTVRMTLSGLGGGAIGFVLAHPLTLYLGFWATLIILLALLLASVLLMFNTSIESILEKTNIFKLFSPVFKRREVADNEEDPEEEQEAPSEEGKEEEHETVEESGEKEIETEPVKNPSKELLSPVTKGLPVRSMPRPKIDLPMDLLDQRRSKPTSGDLKVGKEKIQHTLANFNINVEMGEVQIGPTVTQYTFKPAEGIKLSRITALNDDLALALAAHPVRIEAPIPGKSLVGIEVPNQKPAVVRIREIFESDAFVNRKSNLQIPLGKDVSGKSWTADLGSMPHLLVAGATGSGKSVCLNSIIISLIYQNNVDSLRLILVDPKRVEFPTYNGIPHLLTPVITDTTKTVYALRWAMSEMDRRFDEMQKYQKPNIDLYNLTAREKMPHIVIIIDELADLMVTAGAEVEACIIRLTQMARAAGIHLVLATQRPSVNVITGLIKANIPCRIAFSVVSVMDSRTILDSSGADKLVGKGDMLYMSPQYKSPIRMQNSFVSNEEIKAVVSYLKNHNEKPEYITEITEKQQGGGTSFDFKSDAGDDDELLNEAQQIVVSAGKASTSYLQRRLRIGYARAARLIDLLEEAGVIGPGDGAKPREILVDKRAALMGSPVRTEQTEDKDTNDEENFDNLEDNPFARENDEEDNTENAEVETPDDDLEPEAETNSETEEAETDENDEEITDDEEPETTEEETLEAPGKKEKKSSTDPDEIY